MIVVSDTSPVTALLTVEKCDLLARIFGEVLIPAEVQKELQRAHPALPDWLKVRPIRNLAKARIYAQKLDLGEAEAIVLAEESQADYLLMDERKGRRMAQAQNLKVIGLLGVVLIAKRRGLLISARDLLTELDKKAGVYLSSDLKNAALKSVSE